MTIEQIRNLPPATINTVIRSRGTDTAGLSLSEAQMLVQLNRAAELMNEPESEGSQLALARRLQQEFPQISLRTARRRIADAVTYLYSDQQNTPEQWHELYADKMDNLGKKAEEQGDLSTALKCYQQAHDLREKAAAARVDPALTAFRQIIVSPDIPSERLGLDENGMRKLMQQAYELIDSSSLPDKEKQRLRQETLLETGMDDI